MRILLKVSLVFFLCGLVGACAKDEPETTGGISGLLTREDNGEPLASANISLNPGGKSATTGSDGRFEFVNLEPRQYTVQARCEGYKTNTKVLTVVPGEITIGDMQLSVGTEDFTLSASELQFGAGTTRNTFDIINISVSKSIYWKVLNTCPSWLSVSESEGVLPKGGSRSLIATLKNSPVVGSEGYITVEVAGSTKQIRVAVVDEKIPETVDFTLSVSSLKFNRESTLKSFGITNLSKSRSVDWKILSGYPSWLSLSETGGTLSPGGQRSVNVTLKSSPADNSEGYITVEVAGSTKQVNVTFTAMTGGGDNDDGGGTGPEDYSSVTIEPCDLRLKAQVLSCKRLGSTVVFTCTLTNNGLGYVNDFRIYPPSSLSLINDGVRTLIQDSQGMAYPDAKVSFNGGSASSTQTAKGALAEGGTYQCTVTLNDVSALVKTLQLVRLGVYTYPDSYYNLANKYIDFKQVPVY